MFQGFLRGVSGVLMRGSEKQHLPDPGHVDEGVVDEGVGLVGVGLVCERQRFLRGNHDADEKLSLAAGGVPAGVVAEALWTARACKQLHPQAGEHEHEESQQHHSIQELAPAQEQLVDQDAHLGHQADEAQGTQSSQREQDPG